jgi:uncharacterized membrane protein
MNDPPSGAVRALKAVSVLGVLAGLVLFVYGTMHYLTYPHTVDSLIPGLLLTVAGFGAVLAGTTIVAWWRRIGRTLRVTGIALLVVGIVPIALIALLLLVAIIG